MSNKIFAFIVLFLTSQNLMAQESYYTDFGSWNTFTVSVKLKGNFSAVVTEEIRFKENLSQFNLFYTNVGLDYKINSHFKTNVTYRFINKFKENGTISFRNRLMWDFSFKQPINKFEISLRHRLQAEKKNIFTSYDGYLLEWFSRQKLEVNYKLSELITPYASLEMRYQISDLRNNYDNMGFHRIRVQVGADFKISKVLKLGLYYLKQNEFDTFLPENLHILGFEFSASL
jgi:hypothetical protein